MIHQLAEEGYSRDVIAAVVSVSVNQVPDVWNRVRVLEQLKTEPDFERLAIAFKRVVNIIKQAENKEPGVADRNIDVALLKDPCESELFSAHQYVKQRVTENLSQGLLYEALMEIASLREVIDIFFDEVMVMTDNLPIRRNRLALLGQISDLFGLFADFSKIST